MSFVRYTFPAYQPNWHHEMVAKKLEAVQRGDITRLIVNMPPRYGKSELVSRRFPAWCLGLDPDEQIIACSYNDKTAKSFSRDVLSIMGTKEYTRAFPGTQIYEHSGPRDRHGPSAQRTMSLFEVPGRDGYYLSAGVGGGITGQGATIGLIDDPIKNHEEAYSPTYRDRVWNWYTSTFYTRGEGSFARGGDLRIIVTVTRWHEDDLVGRLLAQMAEKDGEKWDVISLPAILDEAPCEGDPRRPGMPLWPRKYSLPRVAAIRKLVGSRDWNSLYQQRPTDVEGGMFKRRWWKRYTEAPKFSFVWTSWDLAVKDTVAGSYNVGIVFGKNRASFYVLDVVRFRGEFVKQIVEVKKMAARWPNATAHVIEDKANGPAVISALRERIPGILPWNPDYKAHRKGERRMGSSGKVARAAVHTPICEAGQVHLPESAAWVDAFIDELAGFPAGKHDDQVDAFSQGMQYGHGNAISTYEKLGAL